MRYYKSFELDCVIQSITRYGDNAASGHHQVDPRYVFPLYNIWR